MLMGQGGASTNSLTGNGTETPVQLSTCLSPVQVIGNLATAGLTPVNGMCLVTWAVVAFLAMAVIAKAKGNDY